MPACDRAVVYTATPRGEELQPALDALGRWGAGGMREPREGEIITEPALVGALRVGGQGGTAPRRAPVTYEVHVGPAVAHAMVARGVITVAPGPHPKPDLIVDAGPEFRDVLAGVLSPDEAMATGGIELTGDASLFPDFVATFTVPYSPALSPIY